MRLTGWTSGATLAVATLCCGCTKPSATGVTDAASATGRLAIQIQNVQVTQFNAGAPAQCQIDYNVYNNTNGHLYKAATQVGGYDIEIDDLSANTHYTDDQTLTVDPIDNSCRAVAAKFVGASTAAATTACSLEGETEGACQAKVAAYSNLGPETLKRIASDEQAGAKAYADDQAKQFEQAKAAAWAERGQFEAPAGTIYSSRATGAPLTIPAVLAPDFDPSKLDADTPVNTSSVALCPTSSDSDYAPNGRLFISAVYRDQYGLAVWYKMFMLCEGSPRQLIWMTASSVDDLLRNGQIGKAA